MTAASALTFPLSPRRQWGAIPQQSTLITSKPFVATRLLTGTLEHWLD